MSYITYPDSLKLVLDKHKNILIPKKVPDKQKHFKIHHKYYCKSFVIDSYFKIIDTYKVNEEDYVIMSFSDNRFWTIPNEIYMGDIYELLYNKNDILNQNIINSNKSYFGYEIIYWFLHKYDYRYFEFIPYIEDEGKSRLNESCKYFLYSEYRNGKFSNIKIKIDRRIGNEFK